MRRVLRSTSAPILNRVKRIRFGLAVASAVFDSASRRNPLDQGVSQAREQLPELVGPEAVTGGPAGEQVQLLGFDPVFNLAQSRVVMPQGGRILAGQVRAQQVTAFPATGLAQPVPAQGEGEGLWGNRFPDLGQANVHQPIGAARFGLRGADLQQQRIPAQALSLQLVQPPPQFLQFAPAHAAFLQHPGPALRQDVEFAVLGYGSFTSTASRTACQGCPTNAFSIRLRRPFGVPTK